MMAKSEKREKKERERRPSEDEEQRAECSWLKMLNRKFYTAKHYKNSMWLTEWSECSDCNGVTKWAQTAQSIHHAESYPC